MGWNPFKDIEEAVSDIFKSGEKFVSDVWHSDVVKVYLPAVAGYVIGGPAGAVVGGGLGYSSVLQSKAIEKAESLQEKQIAAQKARQLELAGQQLELTEKQMQLQMGQRQFELLANLFLEQDRAEPRIVTLPTTRESPGVVQRINLWIDQALRA